ncbi:MAG: hypothetical protein NTY65_17050 [Planctomycetota bacterium]|nr:hypothetical protein [Planctomycetota bacterium]
MRLRTSTLLALAALLLVPLARPGAAADKPAKAAAQYQGWQHSGSLYILTTSDGANLPASASEDGFPLLVRLHKLQPGQGPGRGHPFLHGYGRAPGIPG